MRCKFSAQNRKLRRGESILFDWKRVVASSNSFWWGWQSGQKRRKLWRQKGCQKWMDKEITLGHLNPLLAEWTKECLVHTLCIRAQRSHVGSVSSMSSKWQHLWNPIHKASSNGRASIRRSSQAGSVVFFFSLIPFWGEGWYGIDAQSWHLWSDLQFAMIAGANKSELVLFTHVSVVLECMEFVATSVIQIDQRRWCHFSICPWTRGVPNIDYNLKYPAWS